MSYVDQISISGIRAFAPSQRKAAQSITFARPATVICGSNGSGKTTIIECLRYATTGEWPPGVNGGSFVHDPKLNSNQTVVSKVKLWFHNAEKELVEVTRLAESQPQGRDRAGNERPPKFKTNEGTVRRKKKGETEKQTASFKFTEMNVVVPDAMGVSKAVLTNVIFCHQEDSAWPLDAPKKLKEKFDEIFEATEYTKLLKYIDTLAKEKEGELKEKKANIAASEKILQEAKILKTNIRRATETRDSKEREVEKLKKDYETLGIEIKEIEDKLALLSTSGGRLFQMKNDYQAKRDESDRLIKSNPTPHTGSIEELRHYLNNFEEQVEVKRGELRRLEAEIESNESRRSACSSNRSDARARVSVLESDKQRCAQRLDDLQEKLQDAARLIGTSSCTKDNVVAMIDKFKLAKQAEIDKNKKEETVEAAKSDKLIDEARHNAVSLEAKRDSNRKAAEEKDEKMREIQGKLKDMPKNSAELTAFTARLQGKKVELQSHTNSFNVRAAEGEQKNLREKIDSHTKQIEDMNNEFQVAQESEQMRYKLESCETNLQEKNDRLLALQVSADLDKIFAGGIPEQDLEKACHSLLKQKQDDTRNKDAVAQKLRLEVSTLQKSEVDQAQEKVSQEAVVAEFDRKARAVVTGAASAAAVHDCMEAKRVDRDAKRKRLTQTEGVESVYQRFHDKTKALTRGKCPLCTRGFANQGEVDLCRSQIAQTLQKVPARRDEARADVDLAEEELKNLTILDSHAKDIDKKRADIKRLDREIRENAARCEQAKRELSAVEATIKQLNAEQTLIQSALSVAGQMDQLRVDVKNLENEKLGLLLELGDADSRSVQEITSEIKRLTEENHRMGSELSDNFQRVSDYNERLNVLKTEHDQLRSDEDKARKEYGERGVLEDELTALRVDAASLREEADKCDTQRRPLLNKVDALRKQKDRAMEKLRLEGTTVANQLNEVQQLSDSIASILRDLTSMRENEIDEKISELNRQVTRLQAEEDQLNADYKTMQTKRDSILADVTGQDGRKLQLSNELRGRELKEELPKLRANIEKLETELRTRDDKRQLEQEVLRKRKAEENNRDQIAGLRGEMAQLLITIKNGNARLENPKDNLHNADGKFKEAVIAHAAAFAIKNDLRVYSKALDNAIMQYHKQKMEQINHCIRKLWQTIYRNSDIDYIKIASDETKTSGAAAKRRTINYSVVMCIEGHELEMRGRCSAGQKVLASLIIRMALSEAFCYNCGVLALDEPTTNLDEENAESLAEAIAQVVNDKRTMKGFQLVIITHDEHFVEKLKNYGVVNKCCRVSKDGEGYSQIAVDRDNM